MIIASSGRASESYSQRLHTISADSPRRLDGAKMDATRKLGTSVPLARAPTMRDLTLEWPGRRYRDVSAETMAHYGSVGDAGNGRFFVYSPIDEGGMVVIASNDGDWDHVSVSRKKRCPNWPEMCHVKRLFFEDDEVVIQFHPREDERVNIHPYCLHLWRPLVEELPMPPVELVA